MYQQTRGQRLLDERRFRLYYTWSRHTDLTHWPQRVSESIRAHKPKWERHWLKHVYTGDPIQPTPRQHAPVSSENTASKQATHALQIIHSETLIHRTSIFLHLTLVDTSIHRGLGQMDIKDHKSHCLDLSNNKVSAKWRNGRQHLLLPHALDTARGRRIFLMTCFLMFFLIRRECLNVWMFFLIYRFCLDVSGFF